MRIFLAFPFTDLIEPTSGKLSPSTVGFLREVIQALEREGHSVFSAHVREVWGAKLMSPTEATYADLEEIQAADLVVAFPGSQPLSGGVHVELGWASSFGKPIVLFLAKDQAYSPLVLGLPAIARTSIVRYEHLAVESILSEVLRQVRMHVAYSETILESQRVV